MSGSSKYLARIQNLYKSYSIAKNHQRYGGVCRLLSVEEGRVKVEFDVTEEQTNRWGTLHGGVTASLVDTVTMTAVLASERENHGVTVDLFVSYLSPAKVGDTVVVDASVTRMGKNIGFTRADLFRKHDNQMIATALHTIAFPPMK